MIVSFVFHWKLTATLRLATITSYNRAPVYCWVLCVDSVVVSFIVVEATEPLSAALPEQASDLSIPGR
jgi:hypothetical protein